MALERGREVYIGDLEKTRLAGVVIALAERADDELAEAEPASGEGDGEPVVGGKPT